MRRAALFDLDGTLVDSRDDIAAAANAARLAVGLPALPLESIVSYVGDGADRLIQRLTPDADASTRAVAMNGFTAHYAQHCCDRTRPYPGMVETLTALAGAGWPMAVVTNKPDAFARAILDGLGLSRWFGAVIGGDGIKKPDPEPVYRALRQLDAHPAASWMIGDHHTDVRAGRAAGLRIVWCTWGIGQRQDLPVDAEADRCADLTRLLGP